VLISEPFEMRKFDCILWELTEGVPACADLPAQNAEFCGTSCSHYSDAFSERVCQLHRQKADRRVFLCKFWFGIQPWCGLTLELARLAGKQTPSGGVNKKNRTSKTVLKSSLHQMQSFCGIAPIHHPAFSTSSFSWAFKTSTHDSQSSSSTRLYFSSKGCRG
jgi:hypothetical protein